MFNFEKIGRYATMSAAVLSPTPANSSTQVDLALVMKQLGEARALAFSLPELFPAVLKQVLNFVPNTDPTIELWCIDFLHQAFVGNSEINHGLLVDLAIDTMDKLTLLIETKDLDGFKAVVDICCVVFRLVFKFVAANDGCDHVWSTLSHLKTTLVNKMHLSFPLDPSDNTEHDALRNLYSRMELVKFLVIVIDYQSKTNVINPAPGASKPFSLSDVPTTHTLIKHEAMEYELGLLLDLLLAPLRLDILVSPVVTAVLNHLVVVMKRKPQFATRVLKAVQLCDTTAKLQSNYQSVEEFKLSKKYVNRQIKVFIQHLMRNNLAPLAFHQSLQDQTNVLTERGNEVRRRNLFVADQAPVNKRKFDGFVNARRKIDDPTFKNLYTLMDSNSQIADFDVTAVPQHIAAAMVVKALQKVTALRLTAALDIIAARYASVVSGDAGAEPAAKRVKVTPNGEDEDDNDFNPELVYTLPPPKDLLFHDKRDHLKIIIRNFFKLANNQTLEPPATGALELELQRVAIKHWKKDLWLMLLLRLATRGMRTAPAAALGLSESKAAAEMSDMIRTAIFDYFLENIHKRVGLIIEWLNEDWYAEQLYATGLSEKEADGSAPTPVYNAWAGKVLDAVIPFVEPNDRKLFIRLVSDLPALSPELVGRIKSLCLDPARLKLGFQSLQFLMMFRPPAKAAALAVLKEMSESEEDVKEEAAKLYKKYSA